jgi:hypothetical protein
MSKGITKHLYDRGYFLNFYSLFFTCMSLLKVKAPIALIVINIHIHVNLHMTCVYA